MRRLVVLLTALLFLIGNGLNGQSAKQKEEVEAYLKTLKNAKDPKARVNAANELTNLGMVRSLLIRAAEPGLIAALKDDNGEVRQAVVATLMVLEPYKKDRVANLLPMLAVNEPRNGRLGAVIMLGKTEGGATEAVPGMEAILKAEGEKADNMRDGEMIQQVNQSLVSIRQYLIEGYIKAVQSDKDAKVRATSAAELAKIAQTKAEQAQPAIPALVAALKDDDADVRKAALNALTFAKPQPGDVIPGLIAIVKNIKEDKGVRIAAIGMLGSMGPNARESLPFLEFLLDRETKKAENDRDKPLFDKLTEAVTAIKK
jgi:HEAT repeat protein